eukprot:CFRG0732T1
MNEKVEKRKAKATGPRGSFKKKYKADYNSSSGSDSGSDSEPEINSSLPKPNNIAVPKTHKIIDEAADMKELPKANTELKRKNNKEKDMYDSAQEGATDGCETLSSVQDTITHGTGVGRKYTVSVALPGSIMANAQSPELKTYLAGQIARALTVFEIDEVIIFNEELKMDEANPDTRGRKGKEISGTFEGATMKTDPNLFLARVLQYLETPQYLRKSFFPVHRDLTYAGLLNPLDAPHHMRKDDKATYREGVTLDRPVKKGQGSLVDCGMWKQVRIDRHIQPGVRVTIKLEERLGQKPQKHPKAIVVKPSAPREEAGLYWGYSVRIAKTMADIFSDCPYAEGYDMTIGTSENGENIHELKLPKSEHLLIVFGGLAGLESALDSDTSLGTAEARDLFDYYVNTCPNQGSRTIRTEEAILVTMSALRNKINK